MDVYITGTSAFLPNDPVENDQVEDIIGSITRLSPKVKEIVLKSNGIKKRYYAIHPQTRKPTHTNARLAAEAIKRLISSSGISGNDIELLACGTSIPDQILPGHASIIHGELGTAPCEIISCSGVCCSGMAAMKYAYANVSAGFSKVAVASASEAASSYIRKENYRIPPQENNPALSDNSMPGFNGEFLRWMLSDGAGAVLLENKCPEDRISLKIEWIEQRSFANELDTCMYAGAVKNDDGSLRGWRDFDSLQDALGNNVFAIQQDVKLLNKEIVKTAVERALIPVAKSRELSPEQIDWFLPHYSSDYFRSDFFEKLKFNGFEIPYSKWFTNLTEKGNTGAASIFIILDELFKSGKIKRGEKLLCFIPESGRFTICYMLLTVV
ncbi:MAG TPA: StlD/DarB family beta-ketosynthase [Nitrospirae bacterium]|nr:StlD/DarB family beta-ketosynthase [Nitrospirota bacterium]